MRRKRGVVAVFAVLSCLFALCGCTPPAPPPRQLTFSVVTGPDSSLYKAAIKFADSVREQTSGRLLITVYPGAQLAGGNQLREFEMLREGGIDFTFDSTMWFANLDKRFGVISLPWAMGSLEEVDAFIRGEGGRKLLAATPALGVVGLAYGENGFRQLTNSRRPVRTPADLKGLKVRVPDVPIWFSVFKTLGAEPTVMTWTAVYKALQEGVLDGQENPLDIIATGKLYDIQHHITLWNYAYDAFILGVNAELFASFDEDTRRIVRRCAQEAADFQVRLSRESAATQAEFLRERGMEVVRLDSGQIRAFRSLVKPVYDEYEPVIGKELMDTLKSVRR